MKKNKCLRCLVMMVSIVHVHAEILSLGSAPDLLDIEPSVSLDGGITRGNAEAYGVRVNARVSQSWLLFASLSEVDPGTFDGTSVGGGLLVTLPGGGEQWATGLKLSLHYQTGSDSTRGGRKVDVDVSEAALRYVVSGELSEFPSLRWFVEGGIHIFETSVSYPEGFDPGDRYPRVFESAEPGLEAGLLLGVTEGFTLFGSAEYVEKSRMNLGLRIRF